MASNKYNYPYGKKAVNYSDRLADQIRSQRKAESAKFREDYGSDVGFALGAGNIATGSNSIAIGHSTGRMLTGDSNVYIGSRGSDGPVGEPGIKGSDLINSLSEAALAMSNMSNSMASLVPSHNRSFKMIIPIGKNNDSVWKKIKHTLGFKDDIDHTDKNYRK